MTFEPRSPSPFERRIATLQDVERYRAEARLMQSRETARIARRLFGAPARLLRRLAPAGARVDRRDRRPSVGRPLPASARHD